MEKTKRLCDAFQKMDYREVFHFSKCTATTKEKNMLYKIFFDFTKKIIGAGFLYLGVEFLRCLLKSL
jgi:hypothetical protein